jgi:hypothetical protein
VWLLMVIGIGLMSGIFSVVREWLSIKYPAAPTRSGQIFQASLWTCFVIAALFVVIRQRLAIVGLEDRLEQASSEQAEKKQQHDLFGSIMQQGVNVSTALAECQTDSQFSSWDAGFAEWLVLAKMAIKDLGYYSDSVEFVRAGENAEPVAGPMDWRNQQEERCRVLAEHQKKLEEIVHRRLPGLS